MGRRNLHTKEALKELILQASYDIIREEGFKDLTARKIAARIGYTAGTLYHTFQSLDDIVLYLKSRALDKFEASFNDFVGQSSFTIKGFFEFYVDYCLSFHHDWSLLCEKHLTKTAYPEWYLDKVSSLFRLVVVHVAEYTGKDFEQAQTYTKKLWSAIQGVCFLSIDGKFQLVSQDDRKVLIDSFTTMFENEIKTTVSA